MFGCSPSLVFVNAKYQEADFSEKTILLWPISAKNLEIKNVEDATDCFGKELDAGSRNSLGDTIGTIYDVNIYDIIRDTCFSIIQKEALLTMNNVKVLEVLNPSALNSWREKSFFTIKRKIGEDSIPLIFDIPYYDSVKNHAINPDVILVIGKINFTRLDPTVYGSHFQQLYTQAQYLFWSYPDSEIIAFGQASTNTEYIFKMNKGTWVTHFQNIAYSLFSQTPFPLRLKRTQDLE